MDIPKTSQLLYNLKRDLTNIYLLFEGRWWIRLMKRLQIEDIIGLIEQSHNELVRLRSVGVNLDYRPFYSAEKVHRMFQDPMHQCENCRRMVRMRPSLRNRLLKKLKVGAFKNANLALVDN